MATNPWCIRGNVLLIFFFHMPFIIILWIFHCHLDTPDLLWHYWDIRSIGRGEFLLFVGRRRIGRMASRDWNLF
jgi:hypothetical protein